MKLLITTLIVYLSFLCSTNAQFALRVGGSGTNIKGDLAGISFDGKSKLNLHAGIMFDLPIPGNIGLRTGLLFNQKGAKENETLDLDPLSFSYLEVPVYAVFDVSSNVFIEAGPYIGYLLSASSLGNDIKEEFKSADVGANIGAGVKFSLITVGLNYNYGITNVANAQDISIQSSLKNNGFTIYTMLSF